MAIYQLLFGAVEWPEPDEHPRKNIVPVPQRTEKLNVRLPRALKGHLEEVAAREGVSAETWVVQVLSRSVRANGAAAH